MKQNLAYLKYVLRHKLFVLIWCVRLKVSIWQALKHDCSKFSKAEWSAYVNVFYVDGNPRNLKVYPLQQYEQDAFDAAWNHHQKCNKHHWQYWLRVNDCDDPRFTPVPMPERYVREMVADWIAVGRAITGRYDYAEWYAKNSAKMILHDSTRATVEKLLQGTYRVY